MGALIAAHGPPPLRRQTRSFAILGRSIIYQQLSPKAAGSIYRRFLGLFPRRRFPSPARLLAVSELELRGSGLSRGKARYLRDLAEKFDSGALGTRRLGRASDEEVAEMLLAVKGVGPWTVDMFLIFGLARPDVLPVGDVGLRKGMSTYFGLEVLPDRDQMRALAEPWRPFRTAASWYLYRCSESGLPIGDPPSSSPDSGRMGREMGDLRAIRARRGRRRRARP